jgi:hypothetical protein
MIRVPILLACLTLLSQRTAAQVDQPAGAWKAERFTRGDTLVVRTESGSVWGNKVRLVEELRIGTRDGDGPDSFGEIRAFALFSNGVMTVFDKSVPALRLFSPTGQYLRTLGRRGAGPGEYRNDVLGLAVDRAGVLIMYDLNNARLNRWKQDGTILAAWPWISSTHLYAFSHAMQVDSAGNTYVLIATERPVPGRPPKQGLARFDRNGKLADTLKQPVIAGPDDPPVIPFAPYKHWFLTRTGAAVSAFSGTYAITVAEPGRGPVRIERVAPRIALLPEERRSHEEFSGALSRTPGIRAGGPGAGIPAIKPYFHQLHSDLDGRIWVQLHTKGERFDPPAQPARPGEPKRPSPVQWRERATWDVFRRDGTYLGQLELPWRTELKEAKGNQVWAIQRGEDDEQYIVRYRIATSR